MTRSWLSARKFFKKSFAVAALMSRFTPETLLRSTSWCHVGWLIGQHVPEVWLAALDQSS